jgi:hypothetical protein
MSDTSNNGGYRATSAMGGWRPFGSFFRGGGDTPPRQDNGNGGDNGRQDRNGQNAAGDNQGGGGNNLEITENIWELEDNQGGNNNSGGGNNNNNNNNNNNGGQQQGGQDNNTNAFDQYVNGLSFAPQLSDEVRQQIQSGDFSSLDEILNRQGRSVFRQAIEGANRLIQAQVEKAVERAVQQSNANFRTQNFIDRMENKLPYTAKPNIAPVARTVLAQFIRKGDDIDTALGKVDLYFRDVSNLFSGNNGNRQTGGRPGSNGFRGDISDFSGSGSPGRNGNGQEDWVAWMTQGSNSGQSA